MFVGDLAADVTDYVLQEHFKLFFPSVRSAKARLPFGRGLVSVSFITLIKLTVGPFLQVITDPLTGRSKGYGFVRFGNEQERDRALGEMMGHYISNRPIRVSIATAKKNPTGVTQQALAQGRPPSQPATLLNTALQPPSSASCSWCRHPTPLGLRPDQHHAVHRRPERRRERGRPAHHFQPIWRNHLHQDPAQ